MTEKVRLMLETCVQNEVAVNIFSIGRKYAGIYWITTAGYPLCVISGQSKTLCMNVVRAVDMVRGSDGSSHGSGKVQSKHGSSPPAKE